MAAGRAKWIPLYITRTLIDGRAHIAPWSRLFALPEDFDSVQVGEVPMADESKFNSFSLTRKAFVERFRALAPQRALGPSLSIDEGEGVSDEGIAMLWERLMSACGKDASADKQGEASLNAKEMALALGKITGEEHGAMWSDLKRGILG
jgi:hypothetical protein